MGPRRLRRGHRLAIATRCGRWQAPELAPDPGRLLNHDRVLDAAEFAPSKASPADGKGGMPPSPIDHHVPSHHCEREPIVPNPTLWQIDMGDGTWAVSCRACRLSYRGPKTEADLLFDTHLCEPVVPLRKPTQ
jgi:hypothetical protein